MIQISFEEITSSPARKQQRRGVGKCWKEVEEKLSFFLEFRMELNNGNMAKNKRLRGYKQIAIW